MNPDVFSQKARARLLPEHDAPEGESFSHAAVLIPVIARADGLSVFYTQRAPWLQRHAGQIAFPGGRLEKGESFLHAALRESHEEVGLDPAIVEPLGYLPSMISISDFRVVAVVGLVDGAFSPILDGLEVSETFEVPLEIVLNPDVYSPEEKVYDGVLRRTFSFDFEERRIWGLTGLLSEALCQHMRD